MEPFHNINSSDPNIGLDRFQLDRLWLGEAPAGDKTGAVSKNSIWNAESVGKDRMSVGRHRYLNLSAGGPDEVGLRSELDDAVRSLDKHKM